VVVTAAFCWFFVTFGLLRSVQGPDLPSAMNPSVCLYLLMAGSPALVYLLPPRLTSVLWGAGSPLFVAPLSLASYREVRSGVLPFLKMQTGEGTLAIAATCLVATVVASAAGLWIWRYTVAHFDRFVGRPWRPGAKPNERPRVLTGRPERLQLPSTVARA
jgi:hypothetical protein